MENLNILVIDDEEEILLAIKTVFETQDWNTYMARDVEDALCILEDSSVDIVIIDYHMPIINGIEGVRLIRKRNADIPIIVFTIDGRQAVADEFLDAGANDFAMKPIKAPDLISRIKVHARLIDKKGVIEENIYSSLKLVKGIQLETFQLIVENMSKDTYMSIQDIADLTGLAEQTTYRYLQFMKDECIVDTQSSYGRIGRPKQRFKLF